MPEATLYRMVLPDHICPYGVDAREMLESAGYTIDEHVLATRAEVEACKEEFGVFTTPVILIDGKRIGGSADLRRYLAEASAT